MTLFFSGPEDLFKILIAILLGGIIGLEREFRDKAAGFRTLIFICMGSTIFSILSIRMAGIGDPGRIAAGIVSGVGFLGAGVILREGTHVTGLTTAATIWLTAALGVGIGAGEYLLSLVAAGLALVVLEFFPWLEIMVNRIHDTRTYELTSILGFEKISEIENMFKNSGIRIRTIHKFKKDGNFQFLIVGIGSMQNHDKLVEKFFSDPEILGVQY